MHKTAEEISQMMRDADPDGSGQVDFEEFVATLQKQIADGGSSGLAAACWERLESELARPAPSTACELAISQPGSVRTSDDRRSKKGSKKEGKKQSGTAG